MRISVIFTLALVMFLVSCQDKNAQTQPQSIPIETLQRVKTFSTQECGSAKILQGKVVNLIIFITEPGKKWRPEDQAEQIALIREAQDFLVQEAKRYGKQLSFEIAFLNENEPIEESDIEVGQGRGNERVDWVSYLLDKMGYIPFSLYQSLLKEHNANQLLITIIANQLGRGYSFSYEPHFDKEKYFVEGSLQYIGYENGQKNCAASYAHEYLHNFGAWDLYQTFQTSKENEKLARKLYPDDIMLRTSYNIIELKIDSLTAYLVGLHDQYKPLYDTFEPKR